MGRRLKSSLRWASAKLKTTSEPNAMSRQLERSNEDCTAPAQANEYREMARKRVDIKTSKNSI
jgi:hypothetical protein